MKITINIEKKIVFLLILIFVFGGFVYAYNPGGFGGDPAVMGHSFDELGPGISNLGGGQIEITNGELILDYVPSGGLEAVNKDYVDGLSGSIDYSKGILGDVSIRCNSVLEDASTFTCGGVRGFIVYDAGPLNAYYLRVGGGLSANAVCVALSGDSLVSHTTWTQNRRYFLDYDGMQNGGWNFIDYGYIVIGVSVLDDVVCNK